MFSWRSLKENGELTERFPILENRLFTQDLSGVHRLGKLTVNEGFLAVMGTNMAAGNDQKHLSLSFTSKASIYLSRKLKKQ